MKADLEVIREGKPALHFELADGRSFTLGRSDASDFVVPNDGFVSRSHVELSLRAGRLTVKRIPGSSNPVFHQGQRKEAFYLEPGDQFVIGRTRFLFTAPGKTKNEPSPDIKLSLSPMEVYQPGVSDRMRMLDLLELPEILRLRSETESFTHIAGLLRSVTGGAWSRILDGNGRVLATDAPTENGDFRTSQRLIEEALNNAPQPILYSWSDPPEELKATFQEGTDWAVCAASRIQDGESLVFYAAGGGGSEKALKENCRLVGLIADMVGRSLSVQRLEGLKQKLQRFFSGQVVSKIIGSSDTKDLEPRLSEGTILFFDIRGFSKLTEGKAENILGKVDELREVMTLMTGEIFQENGVVLQFMGDGILACWNLPFPDKEHVDRACRAALGMVGALESIEPSWRCGIGIHTGEVVAGSMGAKQLFSYTVMGPVVNQASRLEGITKIVEVPILVTKEVAARISPDTAAFRRIGHFRPAGMTVALDVFTIHPLPADVEKNRLFDSGLTAFENGEWETAYETLDLLPPTDRPARYLKTLAEMYRRHPPKDWHGVIELSEK
jgi:adenylate cyclase